MPLSALKPKYLPFIHGKYTTVPGLKSLAKAAGRDRFISQIGDDVHEYLSNKELCRKEDLRRYYTEQDFDEPLKKATNEYLANTFLKEYPELFKFHEKKGIFHLECSLTGDDLEFDKSFNLFDNSKYLSAFDALCSQVPEDFAVLTFDENGDSIRSIHLCAPNYWAPEDKIGRNFDAVHEPVPGLEKIRRHYYPLLRSIIDKGPFYRFGWGIGTDRRLNHHPEPPAGIPHDEWYGRRFDAGIPALYIRTERQTLSGIPGFQALLFTIRTYFYEVKSLEIHEKKALISAIESMTPATLRYKGLDKSKDDIIAWLRELITRSK